MNWRGLLTEAFNKPRSRNIRLVLSLLFIALVTIIIMILFQVAKHFLDPDMTIWESHIYTIIFTGLVAPTVALFVLLMFERLYVNISEENEERKRAEESLKESEERFRALSETSAAAIFVFHDGNFEYVNSAAETITGYTRDELYSMKFWELMHPDQRDLIRERGLARQRGERVPSRYETRILTRDGREKWLDVSASLINYDGRPAGLVTTVDNTERKQAEEALKFERLQLLSIFDSIDEVIYVADPYTYEILYANKAMQDKFGKNLTGGICYREIQNKDAPCEFCTNDIILRNKGEPYRWEFHNPTVNKNFGIVDRIIKWPDGRDVRFEIALDITERNRAENALRESEEKYRELVENANSIILRWDMQGNLTFFNEFAEILFGYSKNEILGKSIMGTIVPLSESTGRDMAEMIEDVKRYPERYKLNVNENLCKNGDRVWIAWTNKAIHDEHGNVVEILSVGNDITERKRAEKALFESDEKLRSYFELPLIGMALTSPEKGWIQANDKLCSILGYPREELFQTTWDNITHPDDLNNDMEKFSRLLSAEIDNYTIEKRFIRKDGSIVHTEISIGCVRNPDKSVRYVVGLMRDITERKRAEEALRDSEEKFRQLAENINSMFWVSSFSESTGWKYLYISPAFERIAGIPLETLYADPQSWIRAIQAEDKERLVEAMRKRMAEEYSDVEIPEFRIIKPDGTIRWIKARVYPIKEKNGEVRRFAGIGEDITEHKQADEDLKAAKAQAELYVDLMGHDINNMNQIGMGFLEMALDTLNLDENSQLLLSKPMSAFENSSKLIDNVRKLQRAKSGELRNTDMDIGQVLRDVQYHYSHLHGRNVSINYVRFIGYVVRADELLYDVFSNLVGNAIKHSNGRPVINIKVEQVRENKTDYHKVSIEDNGPGIPDDLKPMIFNRRLGGGSKAKGSGIGLFLVKTLIDNYGGRVWVEDRVNGDHTQGSRFVVMLPAV